MPLSNYDDDNYDGKDDGGLKRADGQYLVIHDCIHKYCDTVLGQNLGVRIIWRIVEAITIFSAGGSIFILTSWGGTSYVCVLKSIFS